MVLQLGQGSMGQLVSAPDGSCESGLTEPGGISFRDASGCCWLPHGSSAGQITGGLYFLPHGSFHFSVLIAWMLGPKGGSSRLINAWAQRSQSGNIQQLQAQMDSRGDPTLPPDKRSCKRVQGGAEFSGGHLRRQSTTQAIS